MSKSMIIMSKNGDLEIFDLTSDPDGYSCHYMHYYSKQHSYLGCYTHKVSTVLPPAFFSSVVVTNRRRFHQPILITDLMFEVHVVAPATVMVYETCDRHGSHAFDSTFDS